MIGVDSRVRSRRHILVGFLIAALAVAVSFLWSSARASVDTDVAFHPAQAVTGHEPVTVPEGAPVGYFIDLDNVGEAPVVVAASPSGSATIPACGNLTAYTATIDFGDGSPAAAGSVQCDSSGTSQYVVKAPSGHIYKDSGTFQVTVSVTDSRGDTNPVETTKGVTEIATIDDATISAGSAGNITGTEGATANLSATFKDANQAFSNDGGVDPGLTATITWGDGTTSSGKLEWNDSSNNVLVTGSHLYDANIPASKAYQGSVTLKDDGTGEVATQAVDSFTATISDAALKADASKSLTMNGGQASTGVLGSFTDGAGAQAAAADYTASMNWGDTSTSTGTIAKTATGAFSVSGTHTYGTAGSKSVTLTVTDQEGQSVTLTAAVTVPALPLTGAYGQQPPAWPLLFIALIVLGTTITAVGAVRLRR